MRRQIKGYTHSVSSQKEYLPLRSGLIFQMVIGPKLANCPNTNSMKNRGRPTQASIRMYGTRKAPGNTHIHVLVLYCTDTYTSSTYHLTQASIWM